MAQGKKFSGVRYYHRHAEGGGQHGGKVALDWREHQANMAWQRRKRILVVTLCVVLTGAVVLITSLFLLG